jgi:CubicO group peptidase (beta-lactamase class C family)
MSDTFTGFTTNKKAKAFIDSTYPDYPLGNNFRGPAGGLFVSMQDLSKIMVALMNDEKYKEVRILNKETVDTLLDMNFFASRHYEEKQVDLKGYTGGAYGICSVMYFSKSKKTGVCFIANGGNYTPAPTGLNNIQEAVIII